MTYYNTLNIKGEDLRMATNKAESLKDSVLREFKKAWTNTGHTPHEMWRIINIVKEYLDPIPKRQIPITSVRRAMTDLTTEGKLIKTDKKRKGGYGADNYLWRLRIKVEQKELF